MLKTLKIYEKAQQRNLGIIVIGAGGNGSNFLMNLATMAHILPQLYNTTLDVWVYDNDNVEEFNVGKQRFSPADIGENKANVLVSKINAYYGFQWKAVNEKWEGQYPVESYLLDVIVGAVDNLSTRLMIENTVENNNILYIDMGNSTDSGQVIASYNSEMLSDIFDNLEENITEPSCSMQESLSQQNLFINPFTAIIAAEMLWQAITTGYIQQSQVFYNLKDKILTRK